MKSKVLIGFVFFIFSSVAVFAQTPSTSSPMPVRSRVVGTPQPTPNASKVVIVTDNLPAPTVYQTPKPMATATPFQMPTTVVSPTVPLVPAATLTPTFYKPLSFAQIKSKIAEAKRQMAARPVATAMTDSFLITNVVRIAFYDYATSQVDYAVMTKDAFLSRNSDVATTTSSGKLVTVRTIRGNGVNTPILIIDRENRAQLPLLVQYPIERNGSHVETAFYVSTHPGIVTPEVINAGRLYMRNTLDVARDTLQKKGVYISPQVADIAERLSIVEHIDHQRFWNEFNQTLFNEIYALYALNEGQTYRFSVSSAGAGGMVQMIPATYNMVRGRYYNVGLMPDFVEGMRYHPNAAQAMLLYMQMTWSDLLSNATVADAIQNNIATPAELMSAGYNSNPAKLAGYIRRGGANWKTLIPRETQIYLQINASMDKFVPYIPRTK